LFSQRTEKIIRTPENFLDGSFPRAPIAGCKCRGIRAKKECGFRELRGDAGDPKRGVAVAGETEDGVEISSVNEVPEAGIEEAEEGFWAGAAIADRALRIGKPVLYDTGSQTTKASTHKH